MTGPRLGMVALALIALGCGSDETSQGSPASGGSAGAGATGASGGSAGAGATGASGGSAGAGATGASGGSAGAGATGASGGSAGAGATGGVGGVAGSGGGSQVPAYDVNATNRDGCSFGPGDLTTATIGPDVPHGDALPFEHVIVLMQENRSFDHYFSELPAYGVTDVDVAPRDAINYDPDVVPPEPISRFHETRYCIQDVEHHWTPVHLQYNQGQMDGFVATNNPGGGRAMGYYDSIDLPYYYWLAKTFATSDRHFCSLLGPTWPNRFYFYGGTSWGNTKTSDVTFLIDDTYRTATNILDQIEQAGRTWKIYRDGQTSFAILFNPTSLSLLGSPMSQFETDVANDALPNLVILDPAFSGDNQNDEHPPTNMQLGQELVGRVLSTLMSNPTVWQKSVFFLIYDEHGGYYDHVPPPPACEPDNLVPPDYRFDRFGIRTPVAVVSPFTKRGYVSHLTTGITSVTRFIQNRFDLPAMTRRDANAWPMLDMFDFDNPPFTTPPSGAPSYQPDPTGVDWCTNNPPGTGVP